MEPSRNAQMYFTLIELAQRIEANVKMALKPYELTHGQFNILRILRGNQGVPLTAKKIKERMIVANPDITRLIDRLIRKGWVNKTTDLENRRQVMITLTEEGHALLQEVDPIMMLAACNFFEDIISTQETENTLNGLQKMNHFLKEK